jgi:hypothetical protein
MLALLRACMRVAARLFPVSACDGGGSGAASGERPHQQVGEGVACVGVGAGAPCGWTRPSERDRCGARELRASGMDTGASYDASKSVCINSVGH